MDETLKLRDEKDGAGEAKPGEKFELIFWGVIFVAAVLYFLILFLPGLGRVEQADASLAAKRAELPVKEAELERKKAYVAALSDRTMRPDTLERELRTRFRWGKAGEVFIPLNK